MKQLHIVIDAYQMDKAITGTDRGAYHIIQELQKIDVTNRYTILVNQKYEYIANAVTAPNFTIKPLQIRKRATWLIFILPILLLRWRADVYYSYHNMNGPWFKTCRTVISVLDVVPFIYTKTYFDSLPRRLVVLGFMKRSIKIADSIIAISRFTQEEVMKMFNVPASKFAIAYLQANETFSQAFSSEQDSHVSSKYNLPKQFILTIGANEPRKNVARLVRAHGLLPAALQKQYPLFIMGAQWRARAIDFETGEHVKFTGFVDDEDLAVVYHLATVFCFPTLLEGFGIPALEAMAAGTPVVASNTSSLPEVVGNAGVLVNPESEQEIADKLAQVLKDPKLQASLIQRGYEQKNRFSWKESAEITHQVLIGKHE